MRVSLIRHAQTRGNLASNYVGWTDEPLSPEGVATARNAARDESVKEVYTSTLSRTIQTAGILYPNAVVFPLEGLKEMHFGRFEGRGWRELEEDAEYAAWLASRCEAPCPGGESKAEFTLRCRLTFSGLIRECGEAGRERASFVVHGGVIMAIMSGFVESERDYFSWKAGFCGGFVIESTDAGDGFVLSESVESPGAVES